MNTSVPAPVNDSRSVPADCLAIQQDATAVSVDWQGFNPDHPAGAFHGAIFIVDPAGQYLTHLAWADSTDRVADICLARGGWQRSEAWRTDSYDRQVAAVRPVTASSNSAPLAVAAH